MIDRQQFEALNHLEIEIQIQRGRYKFGLGQEKEDAREMLKKYSLCYLGGYNIVFARQNYSPIKAFSYKNFEKTHCCIAYRDPIDKRNGFHIYLADWEQKGVELLNRKTRITKKK